MPDRLGNYRLVKDLAKGGMAQVTLACDPSGTHVVLKRIRGEQVEDPKLVKMFLDEVRLAGMLRHPNIVTVYDAGSDAGEYFFAMEYVHGEDLRRVLAEIHNRRDRLPIAQVLTVIGSAAAGLHHAHELRDAEGKLLGVVHRDVSPANILVGYNGLVKVTDFGIAKATLHSAETKSGTLKGKVAYMSPEQVTGRAMDRRSDVFSLGIVFYEVATARRLFKNENDFLTMSTIVQGEIPPPSQHRPDLPRPVEKMIMKALEPDPDHRYPTANALLDDIQAFMRSIGQHTNANGVADYMKALFGHRPEPWLVPEEPTQIGAPPIDFDGSASGIVSPPVSAARRLSLPRQITVDPDSLIVRAHEEVLARPGMLPRLDAQAVRAARPRRSRRWLVRGGVGAVCGSLLVLAAIKLTGKSSGAAAAAAPATTEATSAPAQAAPPAPQPAVDPAPPPAADPPAAPVAPAAPAAPVAKQEATPPPPVVTMPPPRTHVVKKEPPPAPVVAVHKPAPVTAHKPPPTKKPPTKDKVWDPNSLFAPK